MIGPMIDEAAVTAAEKAGSKPALRIARISTVPSPAASAWATPDMPAKTIEAATLTCARLPLTWPKSESAKAKMRAARPARFIKEPARTKSGIARSGKLSRPEAMRWTTMVSGIGLSSRSQVTALAAKAKATGTSMATKSAKTTNMIQTFTAARPARPARPPSRRPGRPRALA